MLHMARKAHFFVYTVFEAAYNGSAVSVLVMLPGRNLAKVLRR